MNFVEGQIDGGVFRASGTKVAVPGVSDTPRATFGFRPEDCEVVEAGSGMIDSRVYTVEMTGDQVLVTFELEGSHLVAKMPKEFEIQPNATAGIALDAGHYYFFDSESGMRLRTTS